MKHLSLVERTSEQKDRERRVNLWEQVRQHRRISVAGPVWMGKSTLCRWVVNQCYEQTGWLPIYTKFPDLSRSGRSPRDYLSENYTSWLALENQQLTSQERDGNEQTVSAGDWLFGLWQAGSALFVLDGLDEEPDIARRTVTLTSLLNQDGCSDARILVTLRPGPNDAVGLKQLEFRQLELTALQAPEAEELVRQVAHTWGEREIERLLEELREVNDPGLREILTRPGHLAAILSVFVPGKTTLQAPERLMDHLADQRLKITGRVTCPLEPDEWTYKKRVLENLAFHICFCAKAISQRREQILSLISHALTVVLPGGQPWYEPGEAGKFLEDLTLNSAFLWQETNGTYCFESPYWLKFFAASHVAWKVEEGDTGFRDWILGRTEETLPSVACAICQRRLDGFAYYLSSAEWHEVIAMVAGLPEDPGRLLKRGERVGKKAEVETLLAEIRKRVLKTE